MKLISGFKDYYDYLIGAKFGIDEKCIYLRVTEVSMPFTHSPVLFTKRAFKSIGLPEYANSFMVFIGDLEFKGVHYNGNFFYDREKALSGIPNNVIEKSRISSIKNEDWWSGKEQDFFGRIKTKISLTEKYNCPVVINFSGEIIKNPKLIDFQFGKAMDAETAFIKITNFILREKEIINNQTNKEKIISHGFDWKTSFRKM